MNLSNLIQKGQRSKAEGLKVLLQLKAQVLDLKEENVSIKIGRLKSLMKRNSGSLKQVQNHLFKKKSTQFLSDKILNGLLYQIIAESISKTENKLQFVKLGSKILLRSNIGSSTEYLSIEEDGSTLTEDDVYDLLHFDPQIKVFSYQDIVEYYFEVLADELEKKSKESHGPLLKIYELLLSLRGFDSRILMKRIELFNKVGEWTNALIDLKRYVSFNSLDSLPTPLKKLYFNSKSDNNAFH